MVARRSSPVIARLLAEAGPDFEFHPPHRFARDGRWPWDSLAHALAYVTFEIERNEARAALRYLERAFGESPNVALDRLEPLACNALAEIFNIWGVALRRVGSLAKAISHFDAAVQITDDATTRHAALYNRGHSHAQLGLASLHDRHSGDDPGVHAHFERALADLDRAVALDKTDAAAWSWAGLVHLARASMLGLPVRRRLADYHKAVAAYQAGLDHEPDPELRSIMEANREHALQGAHTLESLGWTTRMFGRSDQPGPIEIAAPTRDRPRTPASESDQVRFAPGSAAAPVSLAPGCGVWIHARGFAVLCVLSDKSPPPLPGRSKPLAILDLSDGSVDAAACSAIAAQVGLTSAAVFHVHEIGADAVASALNQLDWTMAARSLARSYHALRLMWDDMNEHVLVGPKLEPHDIVVDRIHYAHIIGGISPSSFRPAAHHDMFTKLVAAHARVWTTARHADAPLSTAVRVVGVDVTIVD